MGYSLNFLGPHKQRRTAEEVLRKITPALIAEPTAEINQSCQPLINYKTFSQSQTQILCKNAEEKVFTGEVNEKPTKIAALLMLGFESDVIEIRLREMYDFVDKIFIGESTNAHHLLTEKPLIWEYLAKQSRFKTFLPKIARFIVDESTGLSDTWEKFQNTIWTSEGTVF